MGNTLIQLNLRFPGVSCPNFVPRLGAIPPEVSNLLPLQIFFIKNGLKWPQNEFFTAVPAVPAVAGFQVSSFELKVRSDDERVIVEP